MKSLLLTILTPNGLAYEGEAEEIYCPTSKGPLGVLPGHTPYMAVLPDKGILHFADQNKREHFFALRYGALEVKIDKTIILTDVALSAKTLEDAERLLENSPTPPYKKDVEVKKASAQLTSEYSKGIKKPYNNNLNK